MGRGCVCELELVEEVCGLMAAPSGKDPTVTVVSPSELVISLIIIITVNVDLRKVLKYKLH